MAIAIATEMPMLDTMARLLSSSFLSRSIKYSLSAGEQKTSTTYHSYRDRVK